MGLVVLENRDDSEEEEAGRSKNTQICVVGLMAVEKRDNSEEEEAKIPDLCSGVWFGGGGEEG